MHELMLAESVLKIVEDAALKGQARAVKRVRLAIGSLAHVDPDALIYCCQLVGRDGPAAQAEYQVERVVAEAWCPHCQKQVEPGGIGEPCPECGGFQLELKTGGDDMRVLEILVV